MLGAECVFRSGWTLRCEKPELLGCGKHRSHRRRTESQTLDECGDASPPVGSNCSSHLLKMRTDGEAVLFCEYLIERFDLSMQRRHRRVERRCKLRAVCRRGVSHILLPDKTFWLVPGVAKQSAVERLAFWLSIDL